MSKFIIAIFAVVLLGISVIGQNPPTLRIVADDPRLPADLFYGNTKVKPLRLRPGTNKAITIDDSDFFVNQHYVDFLSRFPDQGGLNYWNDQLVQCASNPNCLMLDRRVGVSAAFFIELEFQSTGSYVYRFYRGGLGRRPQYAEFTPDRSQILPGASLETSKAAYAESFTQRADFLAKYPAGLDAAGFVDALIANIKAADGVDLASRRTDLIAAITAPGGTRGKALRLAIEDSGFINTEYNPSFVLMQYFGYLKRNPDQGGYDFWLNVLNNAQPNNYRGMVCSFITSAEYQQRFGNSVTHTNQECSAIH